MIKDSKQFLAYQAQQLKDDEVSLREIINDPKERSEYMGNDTILVIPGSKAHQIMKEAGFTFSQQTCEIRVLTYFSRDRYARLGPNATGLDKYKTLLTTCICGAGPAGWGYHRFYDHPHTLWGLQEKLHKRSGAFVDMMIGGAPVIRVTSRVDMVEAFLPGCNSTAQINKELLAMLDNDNT